MHVVIVAGQGEDGWARQWVLAREEVLATNYEQGRIHYLALLRRYPTLVQARWEYAQVLLQLERWGEAEQSIEILLELNADNERYRRALGSLMARTARPERAIELLAPGWQAGSRSFLHGQDVYHSLIAVGRRQEALSVLETLHHLRPDDCAIREQLFFLYIEQGKDQQAQPLATSLATESNPSLLQAIARLHMRLEMDLLAAEYWQQLLELDSSHGEAHRFLASNYMALGRENEALPHLYQLLQKDSADVQVARQIGLVSFRAKKYRQAKVFFKQYAALFPDDPQILLMLATCYRHENELHKASATYQHYLSLVEQPSPEIRLLAAETFQDAGLYDLAIHHYQILEEAKPSSFLLPLARLHARQGQDEKALDYWLRIAGRDPYDVESRMAAIVLLAEFGRQQERLEMLQQLHLLSPDKVETSLLLVQALMAGGHDDEAWQVFHPFVGRELFSAPLLARRGHIFLRFGRYSHAYTDLLEAVGQGSSDEVRLHLLEAAGKMGQLAVVRQQITMLGQHHDAHVSLRIAGALAAVGDMTGAMGLYEALWQDSSEVAFQARLDAAALYSRFELPYEAEEQLRLAWSERREDSVRFALADLMLNQHNIQAAEGWLSGMDTGGHALSLYELRILNGYDQGEDVLELGAELLASDVTEGTRREILVQIARAHLSHGDMEVSREILLQLIAADRYHASAYIELVYLYEKVGERPLALQTGEEAVAFASSDAGLLLDLFSASGQAGLYGLASQAARALVKKVPDSFGFRLLLIQALEKNGEYDEAASRHRELAHDHGGESIVARLGVRLALAQGRYGDGLDLLGQVSVGDMEHNVLQARLLWGMNKWSAALQAYDDILVPAVVKPFVANCAERNIPLPVAPQKSVWVRIVPLTGSAEDNVLQRVLEPAFVLGEESDDVNSISSGFSSSFRWQQAIRREHTARRAVQRREYFHAVRQYELLVPRHNDPTLAFDLAGVYSQLGRIGDEALIYEQIQANHPDFPGLPLAMGRNMRKRRPQTGLQYTFRQEEGWAGHKDIYENRAVLMGWLSLRPRDQFLVSGDHVRYSSVDQQAGRTANELSLSYFTTVFNHLRLQFMGGVHRLDDGSDTGIYQVMMTGVAGDKFEGYIDLKCRVVADTLESVASGINAQEYEVGARLDLLPRLQASGRLFHVDYSDNNQQNGYGFDVGYIFLPDPDFIRLRFAYEYMDSQDGSRTTDPGSGAWESDRPYWSPASYWRNDFSLYYKHRFFDDIMGRAVPGFVACEYRLGHDSTGQALHYGGLTLATEIRAGWDVNVVGSLENSDKYRAKKIMGELVYRW